MVLQPISHFQSTTFLYGSRFCRFHCTFYVELFSVNALLPFTVFPDSSAVLYFLFSVQLSPFKSKHLVTRNLKVKTTKQYQIGFFPSSCHCFLLAFSRNFRHHLRQFILCSFQIIQTLYSFLSMSKRDA
jgi:hypothetical protein